MTAKELLRPRYELTLIYPNMIYKVGDIIELLPEERLVIVSNKTQDKTSYVDFEGLFKNIDDYPHLFRKMNWWEKRTKNEMPEKLISLAYKDEEGFDVNKQEVHEVLDWDMENKLGILNKEKRQVCDLEIFTPEYGYIPVD